MAIQETQQELKHRQIGEAFRTLGYWDESRWFTTRRWVPGTNAGNILFSDIFEAPLSIGESFKNSQIGKALARFRPHLPF